MCVGLSVLRAVCAIDAVGNPDRGRTSGATGVPGAITRGAGAGAGLIAVDAGAAIAGTYIFGYRHLKRSQWLGGPILLYLQFFSTPFVPQTFRL